MKKKYLLALLAGLLCLLCLLCAEASASEGEHEGHAIFPHYNISTKSHLIYCTLDGDYVQSRFNHDIGLATAPVVLLPVQNLATAKYA